MIVRPLLLLSAVFALAGCGPKAPGETHVGIVADVDHALDDIVAGATSQGLVTFDARGQIEPALAESWLVSDDGRSYIFRLARAQWPDGSRITAEQVAAQLRRRIRERPLADALGGVDEVVAMTDRVLELRLKAPRPHLLALLANPAFAVRLDEAGSGPFRIDVAAEDDDGEVEQDGGMLHLERDLVDRFGERSGYERVHLDQLTAEKAIASFVAGETELVLGGRFSSLPLVREAGVSRSAVRYDPVSGLFGLVPRTRRAPFGSAEARLILSRAIDRDAIIETLGVPSLGPRATILEDGLDLARPPQQPAWLADPAAARDEAAQAWRASVGDRSEPIVVGLYVPDGPGGDLLFDQIRSDWGALGLDVQRVDPGAADFALLDLVAPSQSASWFVRQFTCQQARICDEDLDTLVEAARIAPLIEQRRAILSDVGARMDEAALFLPIAAPIRWSLVGPGVSGFAENRYGIHPLTGLKSPLPVETAR